MGIRSKELAEKCRGPRMGTKGVESGLKEIRSLELIALGKLMGVYHGKVKPPKKSPKKTDMPVRKKNKL